MSTTTRDHHAHVTELLPWLVNGTLEADERRRVEEHLARCDACRGELQATRSSFELHATHLPPQALTAHAEDPRAERYAVGDGAAVGRSLVEAHLAHCSSCREELELVRASRRALAEDTEAQEAATRGSVVAFRPATPETPASAPPRRGWALAMAASLLFAVVAAGGWFLSGQQLDMAEQRVAELEERLDAAAAPADEAPPAADVAPDAPTAAELEAARQRGEELARTVDDLEQQVAAMEGQVDRLAASANAPRTGVRYVIPQMLSGGDVLRGADAEDGGQAPAAPADGWVYLAPELPPRHLEAGNRFEYRIRDAAGETLLTGTLDVAEDPAIGPFVSLVLPTAGLPSGPLTLVLGHPDDGEIARYGFVVGD